MLGLNSDKSTIKVDVTENNPFPVELARINSSEILGVDSILHFELVLIGGDESIQTVNNKLLNCSRDLFDYLKIDSKLGIILLNRSLDREECSDFVYEVRATDMTDKRLTTRVNFRIHVNDLNDNKAMFLAPTYTFDVMENAIVNLTNINMIKVKDDDTHPRLTFKIEKDTKNNGLNAEIIGNLFEITKNEGEHSNGKLNYNLIKKTSFLFKFYKNKTGEYSLGLIIKKSLDYNVRSFYSFELHVSDDNEKTWSDKTLIQIHVLDTVKDKPIVDDILSLSLDKVNVTKLSKRDFLVTIDADKLHTSKEIHQNLLQIKVSFDSKKFNTTLAYNIVEQKLFEAQMVISKRRKKRSDNLQFFHRNIINDKMTNHSNIIQTNNKSIEISHLLKGFRKTKSGLRLTEVYPNSKLRSQIQNIFEFNNEEGILILNNNLLGELIIESKLASKASNQWDRAKFPIVIFNTLRISDINDPMSLFIDLELRTVLYDNSSQLFIEDIKTFITKKYSNLDENNTLIIEDKKQGTGTIDLIVKNHISIMLFTFFMLILIIIFMAIFFFSLFYSVSVVPNVPCLCLCKKQRKSKLKDAEKGSLNKEKCRFLEQSDKNLCSGRFKDEKLISCCLEKGNSLRKISTSSYTNDSDKKIIHNETSDAAVAASDVYLLDSPILVRKMFENNQPEAQKYQDLEFLMFDKKMPTNDNSGQYLQVKDDEMINTVNSSSCNMRLNNDNKKTKKKQDYDTNKERFRMYLKRNVNQNFSILDDLRKSDELDEDGSDSASLDVLDNIENLENLKKDLTPEPNYMIHQPLKSSLSVNITGMGGSASLKLTKNTTTSSRKKKKRITFDCSPSISNSSNTTGTLVKKSDSSSSTPSPVNATTSTNMSENEKTAKYSNEITTFQKRQQQQHKIATSNFQKISKKKPTSTSSTCTTSSSEGSFDLSIQNTRLQSHSVNQQPQKNYKQNIFTYYDEMDSDSFLGSALSSPKNMPKNADYTPTHQHLDQQFQEINNNNNNNNNNNKAKFKPTSTTTTTKNGGPWNKKL
jgi:hypothetical protein